MNDVSQGAGLSQGIVNFHFKSKELLLIETLKFISNEYLTSFDKYLKAGDDPKLKIINMIENDFSSKICTPEKISVWFTLSLVKLNSSQLIGKSVEKEIYIIRM